VPGPTQARRTAVVVSREQGTWHVEALPDALSTTSTRSSPRCAASPGGRRVRAGRRRRRVLRRRARAARARAAAAVGRHGSAEWDLATQVVDRLGVEIPRDDALDRVVPAG
jgi:hypothetical protein